MADLITLNEAKEFLKVDFTDEDSLISSLIKKASSKIQKKHGRDIIQATYTDEEYSGEGHEMLFLKNWPVDSVASISVDGEPITDFKLNKQTGVIMISGIFPEEYGNIKATYTGGFAAADPRLEEYKLECLLLVADLFEGRGA